MADEWVSVRARLAKDPKTIKVAKWLASHPPFQTWLGVPVESLPRNVLVSVTVVGFIEIWAVGNSRGLMDGDDAILTHCDFSTIDEISQVPGFAEAMQSVHWLHSDEVDGVSAVRLPNFGEYNTPAEERSEKEKTSREKNRERQRRFRERRNGHNATVTTCNAPTEQNRTGQNNTATAVAPCIDRGVQGGKNSDEKPAAGKIRAGNSQSPRAREDFREVVIPKDFQNTLDGIVSILNLSDGDKFLDQVGFLAKLAFADASGFDWPKPFWGYIGRCKRKANPAGYLKTMLRGDLGEERWKEFEADYPGEVHCQVLLRQIHAGAIQEGGA